MHAEFNPGLSRELIEKLMGNPVAQEGDGNAVRKIMYEQVDNRHAAMLDELSRREGVESKTTLHTAGERRVVAGSIYECDAHGKWHRVGPHLPPMTCEENSNGEMVEVRDVSE